jgi:predicted short-subunit dehydrogenase-like oxidoreductase (DUF2520 family)
MKKKDRDRIAIIGAGRLGTALGFALDRAGYLIHAVADRNRESAEETSRIIGGGRPTHNIVEAAEQADVVFLTTQDEAIKTCADSLSASAVVWRGRIVLHCSGRYPADILRSLAAKGADTASCHPVQTFAGKKPGKAAFKGVYFGLEGGIRALEWAGEMVSRLGGTGFRLPKEHRALYHAACSLASNGLVALMDAVLSTAAKAGLDGPEALDVFLPLIQRTLQNVKKIGIGDALTGPLTRGDMATVKDHLSALDDFPALRQAYLALAVQALEVVQRQPLADAESLKAWRRLLEEK